MVMSPNKSDFLCPNVMVVRMRTVMATPLGLCKRMLALLQAYWRPLITYLPVILESFAKVSPDTEEQWRSNLRKSIIYNYLELTLKCRKNLNRVMVFLFGINQNCKVKNHSRSREWERSSIF